uniref:Cellular retinoic acid binding protein 2 n=1 Tax=Gallus gallus TaxID=9031 RepID=A0A8V1AB82_CHICK
MELGWSRAEHSCTCAQTLQAHKHTTHCTHMRVRAQSRAHLVHTSTCRAPSGHRAGQQPIPRAALGLAVPVLGLTAPSPFPRCPRLAAMPNFSGNWKMKSSENFEELLKALGVNMMLRKIAVAAASKPAVEIKQDGESFYIKTSTTVRTTEISFRIGEEFEEQTVDGRPCKSLAKWESENKMVCEQRLLKGEGPRTGWSRELTNDGELILTMTADDVVCTRVYIRE